MSYLCWCAMRSGIAIVSFVLTVALATEALAWNAFGHKVVAEIAWQQLTPEQRRPIVELLRRHPNFDRDFYDKMPDEMLSAEKAEQDHWIWLQAATWPDLIRKTELDRPSWHYVDFPIFLDPSVEKSLAPKLT